MDTQFAAESIAKRLSIDNCAEAAGTIRPIYVVKICEVAQRDFSAAKRTNGQPEMYGSTGSPKDRAQGEIRTYVRLPVSVQIRYTLGADHHVLSAKYQHFMDPTAKGRLPSGISCIVDRKTLTSKRLGLRAQPSFTSRSAERRTIGADSVPAARRFRGSVPVGEEAESSPARDGLDDVRDALRVTRASCALAAHRGRSSGLAAHRYQSRIRRRVFNVFRTTTLRASSTVQRRREPWMHPLSTRTHHGASTVDLRAGETAPTSNEHMFPGVVPVEASTDGFQSDGHGRGTSSEKGHAYIKATNQSIIHAFETVEKKSEFSVCGVRVRILVRLWFLNPGPGTCVRRVKRRR
ncbi:hypothetical protein B0H19DRAFT_1243124 [Mycena capillaripes]|nr:hypothetical protein B0H19DRAFT_1243124 [Mycena capillaripes]